MSYPGGLAERMTVPTYMVIPVSRDIAPEWVALAEPFSVATRAIRRGRALSAEKVLLFWDGGTIGLAVLQVARVTGARNVVLVDKIPFRRERRLSNWERTTRLTQTDDIVKVLRDNAAVAPM